MEQQQQPRSGWHSSLLPAAAAVATLVVAMLMAQLDRLQQQVVLPAAVAVAAEPLPTVVVATSTVQAAVMVPAPTEEAATATVEASATPTVAEAATATASATASATAVNTATTTATATPCGQVPASWASYVIQPGDSLATLAGSRNSSPEALAIANCLAVGEQLAAGQVISVPALPPTPVPFVCGPPAGWVLYTVQAGDTVFSLAISRGTNVNSVLRANCLSGSRINAGSQIYLPPGAPVMAPTSTPVPATQPPPPPPEPQPTEKPDHEDEPEPTDEPTAAPQPTDTPAPPTPAETPVPTSTTIPPEVLPTLTPDGEASAPAPPAAAIAGTPEIG